MTALDVVARSCVTSGNRENSPQQRYMWLHLAQRDLWLLSARGNQEVWRSRVALYVGVYLGNIQGSGWQNLRSGERCLATKRMTSLVVGCAESLDAPDEVSAVSRLAGVQGPRSVHHTTVSPLPPSALPVLASRVQFPASVCACLAIRCGSTPSGWSKWGRSAELGGTFPVALYWQGGGICVQPWGVRPVPLDPYCLWRWAGVLGIRCRPCGDPSQGHGGCYTWSDPFRVGIGGHEVGEGPAVCLREAGLGACGPSRSGLVCPRCSHFSQAQVIVRASFSIWA